MRRSGLYLGGSAVNPGRRSYPRALTQRFVTSAPSVRDMSRPRNRSGRKKYYPPQLSHSPVARFELCLVDENLRYVLCVHATEPVRKTDTYCLFYFYTYTTD